MLRALSEMLQVDCLRSMPEIKEFGPKWRQFEIEHATRLDWFQTSEWCLNWLAHHADRRISPRILVLREGDRVMAVLPLMVRADRFGLRVLRILGDPHSQYAGLLCRNGTLSPVETHAMRKALHSMADADAAVINLVPADSPLAAILSDNSVIPSLNNVSSVLDLSSFRSSADYAASLCRARRKSRNRRRKRLAEAGAVEFRISRPHDTDYARKVERSMALKQAWLKRTGRVSAGLSMNNHPQFLTSLRDGGVLFELSLLGQPVALELGFLRNRHFYSYLGSFDWRWRDLSPGKAHMDFIIDWLIDNGMVAYDFLAHPSSYKESWSDTTVPLNSHVLELTLRGSIYARCWINSTRPALKRALEAIPGDYRAGLQIVMKQDMTFVA
ncbi:MAG: GNAT family N-acetyltransferase [Rhizobiales bacterium]|nr:GNAT family N-acetyltransferase [Hyphomicrobiales bacterium]